MGFKQVAAHILSHVGNSLIGIILPDRPYWAVKLEGGQYLSSTFQSELDVVFDRTYPNNYRPFDWTLDLVSTGDIRHVKELWLFCPPNEENPQGQSARLVIEEPYTAFQMKLAYFDTIGASGRSFVAQIIGRVTDKASGACECYLWDAELGRLGSWNTRLPDMGTWRDGIMPICHVGTDVQGLRLG